MKKSAPWVSQKPPQVGGRVKVWFDKKEHHLFIETADGERTRDIYGICLGNAVFETETLARGGVRCVVTGEFLAVPGTNESTSIEQKIRRAAKGSLDFYWWRDNSWPIQTARWAVIKAPHGGFATSCVTDSDLE